MRNSTVTLILILFTVILSCRETDTIEPNFPPKANAGADRTVEANVPVVVDASASSDQNRDTLFYSWVFVSKPSNSEAVIEDANVRTTRFTPDMEGQYVLSLTVTDLIDADSDTLTVTAIKDNTQPEAIISNAPNGVDLGASFELQGEKSTDPDGDDLTYSWEIISSPDGSTMTPGAPTAANTAFVADKPGSYTIRLSVSDGTLLDQIEIEVKTNAHIITDINPQAGPFGATIKINGTNFSSDAQENIVKVNGMTAIVTSASHTSLLVVIPQGAGTGPISIMIAGITVTGPVFTYELSHVVSTAAQFNTPMFIAPDGKGNVYISDYDNHLIRRLSADGQLTVFAGNGKAGWTDTKDPMQAEFRNPAGLVVDGNGSIYVADNRNHVIRKILSTGEVMTIAGVGQAGFADGSAMQAVFNGPLGITIDPDNNIYIGDAGNHRIRMLTSQGNVFSFAGNGQAGYANGYGQSAQFNGIAGITFSDGYLYVADAQNHRIRRIDGQGLVSTYAGQGTAGFLNGNATTARFNFPSDVTVDPNGVVVVADYGNHSIRSINTNGGVTTLAGTNVSGVGDGPASAARFKNPTGVCTYGDIIYVADYGNGKIRKIELK